MTLCFLGFSTPAYVPVVPNFTRGTITSDTSSRTEVVETIHQIEYTTGSSYTVTGNNINILPTLHRVPTTPFSNRVKSFQFSHVSCSGMLKVKHGSTEPSSRFNNTLFKCVYCSSRYLDYYTDVNKNNRQYQMYRDPQHLRTGNVTNQMPLRVLSGSFINTYGGGVQCQGPTMNITPFIMGARNYSWDPETYETGGGNMGLSLGFNFPLDGSLQERCKAVDFQMGQCQPPQIRQDWTLSW